MSKTETKVFTITASPDLIRRVERFLALLHFNSRFGHSGIFGMELDGDGHEKVTVEPIDARLAHEVDAIGGVGYGIELARDNSYAGKQINRDSRSYWYTGPAANLYKDGEVVKTIPSADHAAIERRQTPTAPTVDVPNIMAAIRRDETR